MLSGMRRNRSGQAIVIMALAMVAICGMLAMAIDAGRLYFQRRLMQDAVDAGALAGAQDLVGTVSNPNGIPSNALYHGQQDTFSVFGLPAIGSPTDATYQQPSVTQTQGGYTVTTVAPSGYNNKQVQISVSFNATGTFAQILGFNAINIQATATAEAGTNAKTYAVFAYGGIGTGNTINAQMSGVGQVDNGQEGNDFCSFSTAGITISNAKFHIPTGTVGSLNINGRLFMQLRQRQPEPERVLVFGAGVRRGPGSEAQLPDAGHVADHRHQSVTLWQANDRRRQHRQPRRSHPAKQHVRESRLLRLSSRPLHLQHRHPAKRGRCRQYVRLRQRDLLFPERRQPPDHRRPCEQHVNRHAALRQRPWII